MRPWEYVLNIRLPKATLDSNTFDKRSYKIGELWETRSLQRCSSIKACQIVCPLSRGGVGPKTLERITEWMPPAPMTKGACSPD
jgi:hypothetical protein